MDRRTFFLACAAAGATTTLTEALWTEVQAAPLPLAGLAGSSRSRRRPVTTDMIKGAEGLVGVEYSDEQRELMHERIESNLDAYDAIRSVEIPNEVAPPFYFSPVLPGRTASAPKRPAGVPTHTRRTVSRPTTDSELAFLTVLELAELVRTRRVKAAELTDLYLRRLKRYDPELRCVVNLTEERAREQAARADREIAAGKYRGPLHGIPYGVKDMLAVPGYPTTWGAAVYADRVIDTTATVIERLDAAGAVLIAKLSMGELGLNDTWYRGQTMNPWDIRKGASGSSAGSAAAVSAGLVGFAIAEETMGSIVTPATRTGVTGLRPTYGRVSRYGAMTLSWSLDKLGPMARQVEDCAVILEAIAGPDGRDPSVTAVPYQWDPSRRLSTVRVGYFQWAFDNPHETKPQDDAALDTLRELGVNLVPIEMPADLPVNAALIVRVESAAALDLVARDQGLESLAVQDGAGWPTIMRSDQFVPAVQYLQASRIRSLLMLRMEEVFKQVDVFITPTFGVLPITDLTGYPCLVAPNGFTPDGLPGSISFIGRLYGEAMLCTVARAWQEATGFNRLRPAAFTNEGGP